MDNNTIPNTPAMPNVVPNIDGIGTAGTGAPAAMNPATMATPNAMPEFAVPNAAQPVAPVMTASAMPEFATPGTMGGMPDAGVMPGMMAPGADAAMGAVPGMAGAPSMPGVPGVPTFDPTMMDFGATDPLTVPEGPKAPDPVEEELKMPLRAADPVPGSIGSAVSVPAGADASAGVAMAAGMQQTPSVAFNDPAVTQNMPAANSATKPAKKMSKTTLILAGVLGVVVIVALIVVLVVMLQ